MALKKLTTPLTRPLAFAMSYAVSNLAGALADVCVDKMRSSLKDVQIDDENGGGGGYLSGVFTHIRQFIVVTWVIVLVTFGIAYCFLEDWTVIDPNDLDDDEKRKQSTTTRHQTSLENETDNDDHDATTTSIILPADALPASPMIRPHLLQRWFPTHYDSVQAIEDEHHQMEVSNDDNNFSTSTMIRRRSLPKYQMYRTRYNHDTQANSPNEENSSTSRCSGLIKVINQVIAILKLRNTWRVLIFGFL